MGKGLAGPILLVARSFGLCATAPILSTPRMPSRLRFGLAFLLALPAFFKTDVAAIAIAGGKTSLLSHMLLELFVGALIGFSATLVFETYRCLGVILDMRSNLASLRSPSPVDDEEGGPLSRLALALALLIFVCLDGHHLLVRAFAGSVEALPLATTCWSSLANSGLDFLLKGGHCLFATALRFALPALFLLFVLELFLALLGNSLPSLRPLASDRSLRTMVGLGLSLLTLYVTVQWVLPFVTSGLTELGLPLTPMGQ